MEEIKKLGLKDKEKEIIKRLILETRIVEISYIQEILYIFLENSKVIVLKNSTKKTYNIFEELKNDMYKLERKRKKGRRAVSEWTKEEEIYLKENFYSISLDELKDILNKSCYQIGLKAAEMKLVVKRDWTKQELEYLKNNISLSNYELSKELKRTIFSVKSKKRVLTHQTRN